MRVPKLKLGLRVLGLGLRVYYHYLGFGGCLFISKFEN